MRPMFGNMFGNMWKHVEACGSMLARYCKILLEIFGNMWNHVEACW